MKSYLIRSVTDQGEPFFDEVLTVLNIPEILKVGEHLPADDHGPIRRITDIEEQ